MRLSEVLLTNFRCFEQLRVEFAEDLTVFVGNNGAGKTTVLDGVAYALSRILTRLPKSKGSKNLRIEDIRIDERGVLAPFVRVEAKNEQSISWTRTLKRDPTSQTAADIPDAIGDKALFESIDPTIHSIAEGGDATMPVFAYYGVSRAVLEIPERRRNFRKEFRRFDALDNALDPTTRFKDLFEWFYAQERDEMERVTQALFTPEFQAWLNSGNGQKSPPPLSDVPKLPGPLPVLQAVRDAIALVIPGFSKPRIKTNPLRMVLTRHPEHGKEQELSLQMLSDGYRTMLALVMDFARRMAQANPHLEKPLEAEAILLVDEIDLHLHPVWQQTVVPSFRRAFPNTQLILSTHSPQVLTTVDSSKIFIVDVGSIRPCPAPTFGARSCDVVAEVLGLPNLRPPDNEIAKKISALFQALDDSRLDDARSIRAELEAWAKGYPEPDLVRADLLIRRLDFQQKKSPSAA
jgi:predicted ATP-binding protein involved in virulence